MTDYPLLPDRHPQGDFFVCDILDAAPKGDVGSMEHPIFSLSTKPDTRPRKYEHNGNTVEIKPSVDGLATVHDRDILIYCISSLIKGMNEGREPQQVIRFQAADLLKATNRMTTGRGYSLLKAAMERLAGTRISTNITTGGKEIFETFGLIERAKIVRETRDGRMQEVEVKLSDWVFNAIRAPDVAETSGTIFKGTVTLTPTPDLLFYATYSEGFRPGLLNRPGGASNGAGFNVPFELETDEVKNYELGWKMDLADGQVRFNGSADLTALNGRNICLCLQICRAKIFSTLM